MAGNRLRLFLAIEIPYEIQKYLSRRLGQFRQLPVHLRPMQQWHITVLFLGLVNEDDLPTLIRDIEERLLNSSAYMLRIVGSGVFPSQNRPRTLWFGTSGDTEKLNETAKKLIGLAHSRREQSFVPHLTIGTIGKSAKLRERQKIAQAFLAIDLKKPLWFPVKEVVLFRSKLTQSNPIYTKMATFALG